MTEQIGRISRVLLNLFLVSSVTRNCACERGSIHISVQSTLVGEEEEE